MVPDLGPLPRLPGNSCSEKQAGLLHRLAKRGHVLDIAELVHRRGVERPEQLTRAEAGQTLDWCAEAERWAREYPDEFEVDKVDGSTRAGEGPHGDGLSDETPCSPVARSLHESEV